MCIMSFHELECLDIMCLILQPTLLPQRRQSGGLLCIEPRESGLAHGPTGCTLNPGHAWNLLSRTIAFKSALPVDVSWFGV